MKRLFRFIALVMVVTLAMNSPMMAQSATAKDKEDPQAALKAEVEELKARLERLEQLLTQSLEKNADKATVSAQGAAPAEQAPATQAAQQETTAPGEAVVAAAATAPAETNNAAGVTTAAASEANASTPTQVAVAKLPSAPTAAEPQAELPVGTASSGGQPLSITGLLDTYYSNNFNNPSDGNNSLYYTNPNAKGFGLNQAKVTLDGEAGPVGYHADIWFGSGARLFREGLEDGPIEDVLYLEQAYGTYKWNNGATLDAGLFGTIAGLEVAESHLNWNYSRGLLWAWNEPFSHLGTRFSMPFSDTFTGKVMLVNGFDNARDNNTGKTLGYQAAWTPSDKFNTYLTFIHGPENDGTNEGKLKDFSWNATATVHPKFALAVNFDSIWNNNPDGSSQRSTGIGGYARWQAAEKFAIAQRFEYFDDKEARSTGVQQTLKEYTLTFEYKPEPRFITRLEYRRDWSTSDFFLRGVDGFVRDQDTLTLGLMFVLGPKE